MDKFSADTLPLTVVTQGVRMQLIQWLNDFSNTVIIFIYHQYQGVLSTVLSHIMKNVKFLPFWEHQTSKKSQDGIQHKIILENINYVIK